MAPDLTVLMRVLAGFVLLDLVMLAVLLLSKRHFKRRYMRKLRLSQIVNEHVLSGRGIEEAARLMRKNSRMLFQIIKELGDSVRLPGAVRDRWIDILQSEGHVRRMRKRLDSRFTLRRLESVVGLWVIGGDEAEIGRAHV
mgnify:FL=1